ncbi:hypothetical protein REY82_002755 [Klebsiella pneumoniae]|nr:MULTISPECIES: hypothetical protein [Klebsiella]EKU5584158.1 hypothetical protein [Klebsiella pneumoniae]EKV3387445.1 hypothetical protein [Klebsiella pneumoniae]EKV3401811.1 hypothetical protein [Klebsiella pneumoniae]EKV9868921.1 hypothetical protein [Klebsiella pneumoniae]EKW6169410.1 hypothetical protein [Klebsiella pneumoniae]
MERQKLRWRLAARRNPIRRLFRRAQAAAQDIDGKDYPDE